MNVLSLRNVVKAYHSHIAVNDVSFDVKAGTIFGLLGPNGAGKTSLIRIITTITGAVSRQILLNGEPLNHLHPNEIGYMPEERGLYKKMKVGEQLLYLAQLKGLTEKEAKIKLKTWMVKFDIMNWWDKKVGDLSKGMSQKIQFIATVIHDPKLLILDEPFSGLDPINAKAFARCQGSTELRCAQPLERQSELAGRARPGSRPGRCLGARAAGLGRRP